MINYYNSYFKDRVGMKRVTEITNIDVQNAF